MEQSLPNPNSRIDRKKARVPRGRFPCRRAPVYIPKKLLERSDQFFRDTHRGPTRYKKRRGPCSQEPLLSIDGANERIRTADLRITSALLYQLSHVGVSTRDYVT